MVHVAQKSGLLKICFCQHGNDKKKVHNSLFLARLLRCGSEVERQKKKYIRENICN